ncbi:hypothetical protein [Rhodococcus qingshengii]|uniref:hypothetical protein n=1 Tax=Rhodococcus qingshengii TaxID=334542 RepID=UPI0021B0EF94|nr:hypothetical protein [Rhodococcus qingshengii]MCT6736583.1 hypothetical protein [Rhodococcus qingshengii]
MRAVVDAATASLPPLVDSVRYIQSSAKRSAHEILRESLRSGSFAVQPRCGVGGHAEMRALLQELEATADPDILTLTIDSHTRLKRFDSALRSLNTAPETLNGYPLVTHGWQRGRDLNESVEAPLEIRHGSPDARRLFDVSIASGITSFEGGGISYNLPYSKDVALQYSLEAWQGVDRHCGDLATHGVIVDRELFGTLTAVLVPPSISLAVSVIEAVLAAREGVKCISIAYPQGGELYQDVAALRAIPILAKRYLPGDVDVFPVLHEFMGAFPRQRSSSEELILYGAFIARVGGAAKLITKTHQESLGIPDAQANAEGLRLAKLANSSLLQFFTVDDERTQRELGWIVDEVAELVGPLLARPDLIGAVIEAFADGALDIPFSASRHARSAVIPRRDSSGAIRYHDSGALPFSATVRSRHRDLLDADNSVARGSLAADLKRDISYFIDLLDD